MRVRAQRLRLSRPLPRGCVVRPCHERTRSRCKAGDTQLHSWEVLAKIIESDEAQDILCDIGMYVHGAPLQRPGD